MTSLGLANPFPIQATAAERHHAAPSQPAPARHVIVAVNGPGEVAAWLYPFAATLRQRDPATRLSAAILPCVFAAGSESKVLSQMSDVDSVIPVRATMRWILRGERPASLHREEGLPGCVLHLGGELWLSALLAHRLRYRLVVYAEDPVRYAGLADRICLADSSALSSRTSSRANIIGNLMVDAARMRVPDRRSRDMGTRTIALFPGSRAYQVRSMLPFLVKVAGDVAMTRSSTRWIIAQSEFVADPELAAFAATVPPILEGERSRVIRGAGDGSRALLSERGVRVEIRSAAEAMRETDLALTIPGTNTAELAALGIPMMLLLPTHYLRGVPLPGLAGHLRNVPLLGPWITQTVAESYLRTRRFWAHPNRRANTAIVPEVIGKFTAAEIADRVSTMLDTSLEPLAHRLRVSMGPSGGAARLVSEVLDAIPGLERI